MLIDRNKALLLVVDIQERLVPAMQDPESLVRQAGILLRAATHLEIPVVASEQYPAGLGHTVAPLVEALPDGAVQEKLAFSCWGDEGLRNRLESSGRRQIVLAGIEAHVCVLQTALQLRETGYSVFVVRDAVSSRRPESIETALTRMQNAGIQPVTTEMVVFEWLERAGTPEFRELSKLIR